MSFSRDAKAEISRINLGSLEEEKALLAGFVRFAGSLQLAGLGKLNLKLITEQNSIARYVFKLFKKIYDIIPTITVKKNQQLKRNNIYQVKITSDMGSEKIMKDLGMLENREGYYPTDEVSEDILSSDALKKAYISGAFLGFGSMNDPEKNYHLEFVTNNASFSQSFCDLINSFGFTSKIVKRKNNFVVYIKESEQISDLLYLMGASNSLLKLQNIKVVKEMRNNVNRLVNCETANLSKTVNTAVRQIESINFIQEHMGISKLPKNLQEIAVLRIENEDLSLKELGELMNPPLGKSGVNHRLKRIEDIAMRLRDEKGGPDE